MKKFLRKYSLEFEMKYCKVWLPIFAFLTTGSAIFAASAPSTEIGVYRNGVWIVDDDGDRNSNTVTSWNWGSPGDIPIYGDFIGNHVRRAGFFRQGTWYIDLNADTFCPPNETFVYGQPGDIPVVGDWDGSGRARIGVFRNGTWLLDTNGDFTPGGGDPSYVFGQAGDIPVVGDWDGDGRDEIGVFRNGTWILDTDKNFASSIGDSWHIYGIAGDVPVVGAWNREHKSQIGVFRNGQWWLDSNGNFSSDDPGYSLGLPGDRPVVLDMPLQRRIIVAYNVQSQESTDVAQYYASARYIPAGNLCPISNLNFTSTNFATYNGVNIAVFHTLRNQLRSCVNAIGQKQILYIAFSTDVPTSVDFSPMAGQPTVVVPYPNNFGAIGLDSAISDLWTDTPYPVGFSGRRDWLTNLYAFSPQPPYSGQPPYVGSFATFRAKNSNLTQYSVTRFGPTKALALAQINDSIAAENQNGPSGVACFDKITGGSVVQYIDPVIDIAAARAVQAGYSTVIDTRSATFGQASSEGPTTQCLGGAFYFGAYNYGVYRQAGYSWSPGSFGWDINSDRMWASSAIAQGLSATVFPLWEPYAEGFGHFPATLDSLFRGLNWGDSSYRGVPHIWWQMAVVGDPLYRPYRLTRP